MFVQNRENNLLFYYIKNPVTDVKLTPSEDCMML